MKYMKIISLFLISALTAGSIAWKSDLVFSHKFHIDDAGADCDACHADAAASISGKDDLLPKKQTCFECHDEDMECSDCHKQPDSPVILPRVTEYLSKSNHKIHSEKDIACLKCHTGIDAKESVTSGMHLPDMDNCMTCHKTPEEMDGCYLCHTENEDLKPSDHSMAWSKAHGMFSETESQNCKSCHTEAYCIECHQGQNLFGENHPPDFISTHGMSYMVRESDCASCHNGKDYCIECHVEINHVVPVNHSLADWKSTMHGEEAKRDFDNCTVCHYDNDIYCSGCHN